MTPFTGEHELLRRTIRAFVEKEVVPQVAAWEEAGRRGTPALITHGGGMSAPILSRIGFREVARVAHLVDRFGPQTM